MFMICVSEGVAVEVDKVELAVGIRAGLLLRRGKPEEEDEFNCTTEYIALRRCL